MRSLKQLWRAWRLRPGIEVAADLAYSRAYSHPSFRYVGPEMNLINLSNDLNGFRTRMELQQEHLGKEFEDVLERHRWQLYAR